jgi:hypothetical protein
LVAKVTVQEIDRGLSISDVLPTLKHFLTARFARRFAGCTSSLSFPTDRRPTSPAPRADAMFRKPPE